MSRHFYENLAGRAGPEHVRVGGYLRSGFGTCGEGGKEACFGLAGASSKYRLGNACETYAELKFGGEAFNAPNGTTFRINTLVAFSVAQNQDWEQATPPWRELNVVADHIGTGVMANAKAWVGKRYYDRPAHPGAVEGPRKSHLSRLPWLYRL